MSDCNCILNTTTLNENIILKNENINIDKFLEYIPEYDSNISGIWRPIFIPSETVSGIVSLDIKDNIKLKDWNVTVDNGSVDYGIDFFIDCNRYKYFNFKDPDLYLTKTTEQVPSIPGNIYHKQDIKISGFLLPVTVHISGWIDDSLVVNDELRVECKEGQTGLELCRSDYDNPEINIYTSHYGSYNFSYDNESFSIAVEDTAAGVAWYDLEISYEPIYESLLCWYRYYDTGRANDTRIIPGVDIFVSDGDCVRVNEDYYYVNTKISGISDKIKSSLDTAKIPNSHYLANLLASGPQIDWVTENLTANDNGINYPRDQYKLIKPFLSGMSDKIYSDIGKNNYISNKIQLFQKFREKYFPPSGMSIVLKENSSIIFESKFITKTGSNFSIDLNHKFITKDSGNASGYDFYILSGDLKLEAKQSNEIFEDKEIDSNGDVISEIDYNINYVKFNDKIIGYSLSEKLSGVFNPEINSIKFHGLGGINFNTDAINFSSRCFDSNEKKYINNTISNNGPWFLNSYENAPAEGIINGASGITISYNVHDNSTIILNNNLFKINYLRSDSKANCSPFVSNSCQCYPLIRVHPEESTKQQLKTDNNDLFTPALSYYHLPSGNFYAGLSEKEVKNIGIYPIDHPKIGTRLPKNHKKFFPINDSCSYSIDSYDNEDFLIEFPYPCELKLQYRLTKSGELSVIWDDEMNYTSSGSPEERPGTVCLLKYPHSEDPEGEDYDPYKVEFIVDTSGSWHADMIGSQMTYIKDQIPKPIIRSFQKGFFHPNSGWITNYGFGQTAIIPYQDNCLFIGKSFSYNYNSYKMYNSQYFPGYNYLCSGGPINEIFKSEYIGIKLDNSSSIYINNKFDIIKYDSTESPVLEQMPFEYVNMDLFYGYTYNDFKYVADDNNKITIYSISDSGRIGSYLDDPKYGEYQVKLYPQKNINQPKIVTVSSCSGNIITIEESLEENEKNGYIKIKNRPSNHNQSIIVYQPYSTDMDDLICVGKWGNMTYGGFLKNVSVANNNKLRASITKNTIKSWGAPLAFDNDYKKSMSYYFPTTRLFDSYIEDDRVIHTLGYNNDYDPLIAQQSGDLVVCSGNINSKIGYIYLGSYIGKYELFLELVSYGNNPQYFLDGTIKLSYGNTTLKEVNVNDYIDQSTYYKYKINFTFDKKNNLPIYGKLEYIPNMSCVPDLTYRSDTSQTNKYSTNLAASISSYKLKINEELDDLRKQSRIAYYPHKRSIIHDNINSISGIGSVSIDMAQDIVDPLFLNEDYLEEKSKDFSPYLDLHVFTDYKEYAPIKSASGYVYFENFMKPVSSENMKVPHNSGLYWINILPERENQWSILTKKGILLSPNVKYGVLKKLSFNCSGESSTCSERYVYDICENKNYELTNTEILNNYIGLDDFDQQFLDIYERSFPNHCNDISYCCDDTEISEFIVNCKTAETKIQKECKEYWENKKWDVSCLDITCPTGNISGKITISKADYLIFNLKSKPTIETYLNKSTDTSIRFFNRYPTKSFPCTNLMSNNLGFDYSFKSAIYCSESNIEKDCSNIINLKNILYNNNAIGRDYILMNSYPNSSYYMNISPFVFDARHKEYNGKISPLTPLPSSIILENELWYRSAFGNSNKISLPFEEYDRKAESDFVITHTFNVSSTGCVDTGTICYIKVDNFECSFDLNKESDDNLYLTSPCFKKVLVATNSIEDTIEVLVASGLKCGDPCTGIGTTVEDSYAEAVRIFQERYPESIYDVIDIKKVSSVVACSSCCFSPDSPDCDVSIEYIEEIDKECHCPDYAELIDTPPKLVSQYGEKCCSYTSKDPGYPPDFLPYFTGRCMRCITKDTDNFGITFPLMSAGQDTNCGKINWKDTTHYFPASCFDQYEGPNKEQVDQYEGCEGNESIIKQTIQEVLAIKNSPKPTDDILYDRAHFWEEYVAKGCQIAETFNDCAMNCCGAKEMRCDKVVGYIDDPDCIAKCYKEGEKSENALIETFQYPFNCYSDCNERDSIPIPSYGLGVVWQGGEPGRGLYEWVGQGPNTIFNWIDFYDYGITDWSTSWGGSANVLDPPPITYECDYSACSKSLQDRIGDINQSKFDEFQYNHIFINKTFKNEYKFITREINYVYKIKKSTHTITEDPDIDYVYRDTYKAKIKLKSIACDPECNEEEKCCEITYTNQYNQNLRGPGCIKQNDICCTSDSIMINFSVKFDIYKNIIVGYLNDNIDNKFCSDRSLNEPFKCPSITYTKNNDNIIMCDSVKSSCTNCQTGKVEVL